MWTYHCYLHLRRVQTNATIVMSNNNQTATLTLGGKTLVAEILSPIGVAFYTQAPVRLASDPTLAGGSLNQDQSNVPSTTLTIAIASAGAVTIEVLFKCVVHSLLVRRN